MCKQHLDTCLVLEMQFKHIVIFHTVIENVRDGRNVGLARSVVKYKNIVACFQFLDGYLRAVCNGYERTLCKTAAVLLFVFAREETVNL